MDDKLIHVDLRPIGSDRRPLIPPHLRATGGSPPVVEEQDATDEDEPADFATFLLAAASVFGVVGLARLAWNVAEGQLWDYGNFAGFYLLDRSMPYFAAVGLFVIAAGVWRR